MSLVVKSSGRNHRNYLLRKLENYERKEIVDIEAYTIEHIMPQNESLSEEWKQQLGNNWKDIQDKYLHTLGNLTLTRYNSEMSDRPFAVKRDMDGGFGDSPLRLNRGLGKLEAWNEIEIKNRVAGLAERAILIWQYPNLSKEVIAKYTEKQRPKSKNITTIEDFPELSGYILELFENLRKRIKNLDSSVKEEFKKKYIAYKSTTNFVDIVPQMSRLRLTINMEFNEIHDPKGICKDTTNVGKWGNGDVEVGISNMNKIDNIMYLIKQSFDLHRDED